MTAMSDYGCLRRCNARIHITGFSDKEPMQLISLQGKELLSSLYSFRLGVQTKNNILTADKVFGKLVTLTLIATTEKKEYQTYKTGYIANIEMQKQSQQHANRFQYYYEIELVPKFSFLQYHHDCRVFKNKNCTEIISAIFQEHGFSASTDYLISTKSALAKTPFPLCVQYQESDYQFIQRLMAACGLFYFFKHDKAQQKLMIKDNNNSAEQCQMDSPPYLIDGKNQGNALLAGFYNLFFHSSLPEINAGCTSYDGMDPTKYLYSKSEATKDKIRTSYLSSHAQFGTFISDSQWKTSSLNQQNATLLLNQSKSKIQWIRIHSTLPAIAVGSTFTTSNPNFKSYFGAECANNYFICDISYDIKLHTDNQQLLGNTHILDFEVLATPATNPVPALNPALIPPSPILGVIHHAYVVDKEGNLQEESTNAVADEYGMPYIGLQWDQTVRNKPNPKQYTALNTIFPRPGGFFDVPHPGETVKVQFADWRALPYLLGSTGDNKNYKFPLKNPKTQTAILSRPTTQDVKSTNQILFEDKQGEQKLSLDAPLCFNLSAAKENDSPKFTLSVDKEGNLIIEAKSITIKSTEGNMSFHSAKNIVLDASKEVTITAGSSMNIKAGTRLMQQAGSSMNIKTGTDLDQEAGTSINIKANASMKIKSGIATIDGGGMLTLKAGLIKEN